MAMRFLDMGQEDLVAVLANGNEEAWYDVVCESPCIRSIHGMFVSKLAETNDGEDAFQDFLIMLYQSICKYQAAGGLNMPIDGLSWTMAKRMLSDYRMKYNRRQNLAPMVRLEQTNPDGEVINLAEIEEAKNKYRNDSEERENIQYVDGILQEASASKRISDEEMQVINLFYYEDISDAQIAVSIDRPVNTVKSMRQRAVKKLQLITNECTPK